MAGAGVQWQAQVRRCRRAWGRLGACMTCEMQRMRMEMDQQSQEAVAYEAGGEGVQGRQGWGLSKGIRVKLGHPC